MFKELFYLLRRGLRLPSISDLVSKFLFFLEKSCKADDSAIYEQPPTDAHYHSCHSNVLAVSQQGRESYSLNAQKPGHEFAKVKDRIGVATIRADEVIAGSCAFSAKEIG